MIKVDDRQIKKLERDLKHFNDKAFPFATKNTVNTAAFDTQRVARLRVSNTMTERNRFTQQSIRVEQARTLDVKRQAAIIGSTADYMEDQEFGGTKRRTGRKGVAIPTGYSAGQSGSKPRTRLPRAANKLQRIKLKNKRKTGRTRTQQNKAAIMEAAKSGNKFVYLDLGKSEGIFRVVGGKRKPRIKMVYNLSHDSVRIPARPWLKPSVDAVRTTVPGIYAKSLRFQLRRLGIFDGV